MSSDGYAEIRALREMLNRAVNTEVRNAKKGPVLIPANYEDVYEDSVKMPAMRINDADVERIARRVVELLRQPSQTLVDQTVERQRRSNVA